MIRHTTFFIFFILINIPFGNLYAQDDTSHEANIKALNEARKNKDYKKLADLYSALAKYEEETNRNYERSFEYLRRALEYYNLEKDTVNIKDAEYDMARHLIENGMYNEAFDAFKELEKYYLEIDDKQKLAAIGLQYFTIYFEKLDINKAKDALDKSKVYLDSINDQTLHIRYLIESIRYHEIIREYDEALVLSNLCIEESLLSENNLDQAKCLALRGNISFETEDYLVAIYDYEQSLSYLEKIPYSKNRLEVYGNLAECYGRLEDYEKAYEYRINYADLQDSILNENRVMAVNNITYKFETRQKNAEIKLLEKEKAFAQESNLQQKRALTVLVVAMTGLLFGIYYIVRFYREKINTAKIIEEQNNKINKQTINELQDKIQINSMYSMIQGQEIERERIAKDLHDSLGGLLSTIKLQVDNIRNNESNVEMIPAFQNATQLLDTAVSEVRSISQNLQPGALSRLGLIPSIKDLINRYDSKTGPEIIFQHFDIPTKIDQTISLSIYRIIQEILNNAIKHAKANEILLQLNKEGNEIVIHIEDDGVGFDAKRNYQSMGLKNIKSRVNYMKGSIEIDSRIGEGTSFLIHVNIGA
ncbi:MAG: sensor histidine kinase [Saprospiraceae bacterium]|nr:sensor histidine kinase [Bacteroidia bacterium]NNL91232.1 sensor histidine kinase [Saprospiraceae bacterium]